MPHGDKITEVTLHNLIAASTLVHPTVMMRKSAMKAKQLFYDPAYIYSEDYNLWADAEIAGLRIVNLPDVFVHYRASRTQTTQLYHDRQKQSSWNVKRKIAQAINDAYFDHSIGCEKGDIKKAPVKKDNFLTLIIPFLNEGEEVANTLRSIRDQVADDVEIIVINDGSDDGWDYASVVSPFRVTYVENKQRKGVARNRDFGVSICQTPYFLLLDAHMRFYDNRWEKRLVSLLKDNDRVLLCCQTRFLEKNKKGEVSVCVHCPITYGAITPFNHDRIWPDIDWNYHEQYPNEQIEPIANVLGAGYAASKRYWKYLHGLQGLKKYGSDEELISFKVWREGGKCLLVKDVVIGHIYRKKSPYKHYEEEEIYNKLLISNLVFSQSWRCRSMALAYRKCATLYQKVLLHLYGEKDYIEAQKAYLSSIFTVPFEKVLQLHKARLGFQNKRNKSDLYVVVNNFLLNHPLDNKGLYEGCTGQLLWFCHYIHRKDFHCENKEMVKGKICSLCGVIEESIKKHLLSWTFAQGLSGIGWAIIYLYVYHLLDENITDLLPEIDRQLQEIEPKDVPIENIDNGIAGILAYAVMRMKTGIPVWSQAYTDKLRESALRIIKSKADLPSTYYAMFYIDLVTYGNEEEIFCPRISEWLKVGQYLPSNRKYWKPTLMDGCIGALIVQMNS